ncbi:MAG TPA: winged helix-turn-helix domain-containing protein [Sphingomonas sp.]|nr:winged helix-turn-helix domain-containing protein [Sphingomonas sp.]
MVSIARVAEIGALVGDPARAAMLTALLDGRALSAGELAACAGVAPQTASGHLARLAAAGLIRVERQGRRRYHRLASADVAAMLESMHVAGERAAPRPIRTGPADAALRAARSCYDHLAGRLAVDLADALTARGWVDLEGGDDGLSAAGAKALAEWGVDVPALRTAKRRFCRPCLDWSERRPHVAGALGAAILDRGLALGWLRRRSDSRALIVTPIGAAGFRSRFGIEAAHTRIGIST